MRESRTLGSLGAKPNGRATRPFPEWKERVAKAIAQKVAEAHRKVYAAAKDFLGRAGVLAVSFIGQARTRPQYGG